MANAWQQEAKEYDLNYAVIEEAARASYYLDWHELPTGNFPPTWESTSSEVRDWVRHRVVRILLSAQGVEFERGTSLNSLTLGSGNAS